MALADRALATEPPATFAEQLDTMKVLTAFRVGVGKLKDKGDDDEPDPSATMADMRRAIEETGDDE